MSNNSLVTAPGGGWTFTVDGEPVGAVRSRLCNGTPPTSLACIRANVHFFKFLQAHRGLCTHNLTQVQAPCTCLDLR